MALEAELGKEQKNLSDLDEGKWYPGKYLRGREKRDQKKEDAREAVEVGGAGHAGARGIVCVCACVWCVCGGG